MTRRQPSEPRTGRNATATEWRRHAYGWWMDGDQEQARWLHEAADFLESEEPIAHQPAGTVGIVELMKGG
jgi:hypothetical protein